MNVHYVDKAAFMNVDIVDKNEKVFAFLESPNYDEVVEETRIRLKWMDSSDQVELVGRYDVGTGHKCRMKTMPIKSNLQWSAYKEVVASSEVKSLELFATKVVKAPLFDVDLNQTLVDDMSPISSVPPIVEQRVEVQAANAMSQPPVSQSTEFEVKDIQHGNEQVDYVNVYPQHEFEGGAPMNDDGHDSEEEDERHHNILGDIEALVRHKDMDPDIIYQRACVDDSDDEGPGNELDEDGFTEKEAQ